MKAMPLDLPLPWATIEFTGSDCFVVVADKRIARLAITNVSYDFEPGRLGEIRLTFPTLPDGVVLKGFQIPNS